MKYLRDLFAALPVVVVFSCALSPLNAQKNVIKNPFKKDVAKQESSLDDKSAEEFYLDMKDFAEGLYNKQPGEGDKRRDSDFKRRVDTEYENLRWANAQRAYEVNLSAHSEVKYVIEDRFRVFSGLYDNLLVQELLNRTGQSILPKTNDHLYTFKLIADPIPRAETLATGTIYLTTGLVALLDTKSQLAYVLAHEAAHVYKGHFKTEIMINLAAAEYAAKIQANQEAVQRKVALFSALAGGAIGAIAGRSLGTTVAAATLGGVTGLVVDNLVDRSRPMFSDWNRVQEDEADQTALQWISQANQNLDDIPRVYQVLKDAGDRDDRVTLGFLGRSNRVRERAKKVEEWLTLEKKKPEFAKRVVQASDPDFDILIAEVKRDNGILAYQYDMLDTAKSNLEKAVAIKRNDATALYFYAKIVQETARTDEDRAKAQTYFRLAAENDHRNLNFGANVHRAVAMLKPDATSAEKVQGISLLKSYLEGYYLSATQASQKQAGYPPHIETIYDYMDRLGEFRWVLNQNAIEGEAAREKARRVGTVEMNSGPAPIPSPGPAVRTIRVTNKKNSPPASSAK